MADMILLYIQQDIPLIAYLSKIYNHTSFQDHKLSGTNVASTSKVLTSVMLLLDYREKIMHWDGFQWDNIHTTVP
jgi:hypothetical protein